MPGYTPHYSDWTAAANISSGVAVWQNPVYDGWLRSVVDRWVQSMGTYCYNDGSVALYKPRRGMSNKDWAYYLMWREEYGFMASMGEHIRRAFAQRHAVKSGIEKWSGSEDQRRGIECYIDETNGEMNARMYIDEYRHMSLAGHTPSVAKPRIKRRTAVSGSCLMPGDRYYIDEVIGKTDMRIYTDEYLYTLAKGYYTANPELQITDIPFHYGCYARRIIDDDASHTPQYESLWKDGKFNEYLMAAAKAQTRAAVNGFIESKREDRKVQHMKKRAKKGK